MEEIWGMFFKLVCIFNKTIRYSTNRLIDQAKCRALVWLTLPSHLFALHVCEEEKLVTGNPVDNE